MPACHNHRMEQRSTWLPPVSPTPASEPGLAGLPPAHEPAPQPGWRRLLGPLVLVGALLAKFKGVLLLLPKIKLLTTSASMLVSIVAYSVIWGWRFAVGFVLLLLVHELGHVIQLRREGIEASAPMFIPFLGAVVAAKSLGDDAAAEARVGLAGPILGSLGAARWCRCGWSPATTSGRRSRSPASSSTSSTCCRSSRSTAVARWRRWRRGCGSPGCAAMLAFAVVFPNPIILVILVLAAFETWRRWKERRAGGDEVLAYYRVSRGQRLLVGAVYIGLIAALAIGMDATHLERTLSDV